MINFDKLVEASQGPQVREYVYKGIMEIEDPDRRLKAAFAYIITLLTLRRTAAAHIRELWINWELGAIQTPIIDPCRCINCWREAHEQWLKEGFEKLAEDDYWDDGMKFNDVKKDRNRWPEIVEEAELEVDRLVELAERQFSGKTENWSRTIPFGFSERATAIIIAYFERFDYWDESAKQINDLIKEGAANRPEIDEQFITSKGNRSDGITFFAKLYPEWSMVREIAAHFDVKNTMEYIRELARLTVHQAYVAADKEEMAPPVNPANPEAAFPILLDETPREGEWELFEHVFGERLTVGDVGSEARRKERHELMAEKEFNMVHPRDFNLPEGRRAFPAEEIERKNPKNLPGDNVLNFDALDEITIKGNETLKEFQQPHSLSEGADLEERPFHQPTDPEHEQLNAFSSSGPLGSLALAVGSQLERVVHGIKKTVKSLPAQRELVRRRTEIEQIAQGLVNYLRSDHPATINWQQVGAFVVLWIAISGMLGALMIGSGFYDHTWLQVATIVGMSIQTYRLPWDEDDLDVADILPVEPRNPTTTRSPFVNSGSPLQR